MRTNTQIENLARALWELFLASGKTGATARLDGERPAGWAVGAPHGNVYNAATFCYDQCLAGVTQLLSVQQAPAVGLWNDGTAVYLDTVDLLSDKVTAIQLGQARRQIAIYNLDTKETLNV